MLCAIAQDHLEDNQDVPNCLLTEAGFKFPVDYPLNILFPDILFFSEIWEQMALNEEAISRIGGFLDVLFLVGCPNSVTLLKVVFFSIMITS